MKTKLTVFIDDTRTIADHYIEGGLMDTLQYVSLHFLGNEIKKERRMCKWADSVQMEFSEQDGRLTGLVLKIVKESSVLKMPLSIILREE
jgi:hypothetical protein